jgi:hypothetical protein
MTTRTTTEAEAETEVFDVANWLDRATGSRPPAEPDYVPKHRAEVPVV